jgi:hypothetical protein
MSSPLSHTYMSKIMLGFCLVSVTSVCARCRPGQLGYVRTHCGRYEKLDGYVAGPALSAA